jgi:osmotically-inducible protein OsmY
MRSGCLRGQDAQGRAGQGKDQAVSKIKDVRMAVEKELGFDPRVDSSDIKVMNIGGHVNLTGTVPSFPQYLQASAAARRVAGVTSVENNLEVVLPESDYRDDVKLITAANNALAANVTVPDSVEAMAEDGNVTLTGTVSYGTERAVAAEAVAGLTGVRNVWNDIVISYDIDPVDVGLHVQEALDRSALVPDGSDVTADTVGNVITLTGHVRTWAEHDAVLGAAWMAYGVIDVRDNLQVTG